MQFDIPSQALEDALYAFGAATGITVFVDGSNVRGRQSTAVKGPFEATQALRVLLTGTGLNAHLVGAHAITLSPIPSQDRPNSIVYRRYSADLQNAVLGQLCNDREARLGTYRVAMQVWLDERGGVQRVELLSTTGDQARDRRVHELIEGISIGKPPPKLPQPIVMVILPRSPQDSGDCRAGHAPSPPRDAGGRHDGR